MLPIHSYVFGGVSAVWDFKSEMQMTSWQNEGCQSSAVLDLMKNDKRLQTEPSDVCCTEGTGIIVLGECTYFELRNDLETKTTMFLGFCTDSLLCFFQLTLGCCRENKDAAHTRCTGEYVSVNNYITFA